MITFSRAEDLINQEEIQNDKSQNPSSSLNLRHTLDFDPLLYNKSFDLQIKPLGSRGLTHLVLTRSMKSDNSQCHI